MSHTLHPIGVTKADAHVDIVFIHGLEGDAHTTWQHQPGESDCWLHWLKTDITDANIWTCGYPASKFREALTSGPGMGINAHASAIIECLHLENIGSRPLILVCHSLGGLMAKAILQVCSQSEKPAWMAIAAAIKGVVFIGTPHAGSLLANVLSLIPGVSTITRQLQQDDDVSAMLDRSYRAYVRDGKLKTQIFIEALNTTGFKVVPGSSADPKIPGCECVAIHADHKTICKPQDRQALLYRSTRRFIEDALLSVGEVNAEEGYERFTNLVDPSHRLTLADKLTGSGRAAKVAEARAGEERITKRLNKNILQPSAKRKWFNILTEVKRRFEVYVESEIKTGTKSNDEIDKLTFEKVVEPIAEKYKSDDIAPLNHEGADDTIMYLAGKCHLRWDNGKP